MAKAAETSQMDQNSKYDGRFGENFDDEVSVSAIVWTTIGLTVACVLGMLITWGMKDYYAARAGTVQPSPIAEANERRMPVGPLLQRDPEAELEAMREEMAERLGGYGWVDEGSGIVHIPLDQAMAMLVEQGSVAVGGSEAAVEDSAP